MNYLQFKEKTEDFPLFSTKELKLIFAEKFGKSLLNNLKNWEKKGYIIKLRKGLFVHSFFKQQAFDPMILATKVYEPSYVSLESALGYYGIIPEAVYTNTSVTTRKTKVFQNDFGKFVYQKIKKEAFGGFETIHNREFKISFKLALPEKALVDFFYLNSDILDGKKEQFEGYRFDDDFGYDKRRLRFFSKKFNSKKVDFLTANFIKYYASPKKFF